MNFSTDRDTSLEKMNCSEVIHEESDLKKKKVAGLAEKFTQLAIQLHESDIFEASGSHKYTHV